MTALTEFLFPAPARRSAGHILSWWERRRPAYNVAVGAAGLVSVAAVYLVSVLPPFGGYGVGLAWMPAAVVFGVMANACYLFGPLTEILIHKVWGNQVLPTGPALFRMGLTFSVGLALLPTLVAGLVYGVRLVAAILTV